MINHYQSVAFSSQRYDISGVYATKAASADTPELPLYVSIISKYATLNLPPAPRTILIKGELAREFASGFIKLRDDLRGPDPAGHQEWRWNDSVLYPYIGMWVAKMDAIKFALQVMHDRQEFITWTE